eukprot:gb/GECG01015034.1/.p1 GENE.gb/GECG01015034.1/~~gb/GECG01015034.1/.p1  ORF type:complete len:2451 (+),score=419.39 gb/GECG01015034.1/:1-7353(+)
MPPKNIGAKKRASHAPASKEAGTSAAVVDLVASIRKHRKFKQLASYSVQCLCKVVTPPQVGWEENLDAAFDAGAVDAITDVLNRHKGDEGVLAACNQTLAAMATRPKMAGELVASGAMGSMLESVIENPEGEGSKDTLDLLETVSMYNPESLLQGSFSSVLKKLHNCGESTSDYRLRASAIRTMERLNKIPGGSKELVDSGAVNCVLSSLNSPLSKDESSEATDIRSMVEGSFRLLDRLCRHKEHAEYIRERCDGLGALSQALETQAGDEKICKAGSRVLSKMASSDIPGLVQKMNNADNKKEREFLSGLLANLAVEEENVNPIVEGGGQQAFLSGLKSGNTKTVTSSSRALGRIADTSKGNLEWLIREGATTDLVEMLSEHEDNAEVVQCALSVLTKFATNEEYVSHIEEIGGIGEVIEILAQDSTDESIVDNSLAFIEHLATVDYDMERLVSAGVIDSILASMETHEDSESIQLNALRCLIYMSYDEANIEKMVEKGIIEKALKVIESSDRKEAAEAGCYLLTSLSLIPEYRQYIQEHDGLSKTLSAVVRHNNEQSVRREVGELMGGLVDGDSVENVITTTSKSVAKLFSSPSEENSVEASNMITKAASFSIVPRFAQIMRNEGINALVDGLKRVTKSHNVPKREELLVSCSKALYDVATAMKSEEDVRALDDSGGVHAVVSSLKGNPRNVNHVNNCVSFLEKVAYSEEGAALLGRKGAIEACGAALRANKSEKNVVRSSVDTLLRIASTDEGALAVAKHGATRQIITALESNRETPDFTASFQKCIALLERISLTSEGSDLLVKQGAVDAVTEAMAATSSNAKLVQAGTSLLAKLVTRDDIEQSLDTLEELSESTSSLAKSKDGTYQLISAIGRIGHFANVSTYGKDILEEDGGKTIVGIMDDFMKVAKEAQQRSFLPAAILALSRLAASGEFPEQKQVLSHIGTALNQEIAVIESMNFISNFAKQSFSGASTVLNDYAFLERLIEQLEKQKDSQNLKSCFDALASLSTYPETVDQVATTRVKRVVNEWVDDNWEDAPVETLVSALTLMSKLAYAAEAAAYFREIGTGNMLKTIVSSYCVDSEETNTSVFRAVTAVVLGLAERNSDNLRLLHDEGTLRRIMKAVQKNKEYLNDPDCMELVLTVLSKAYGIEDLSNSLEESGASGLIMAAMSSNATSSKVLNAGTQALQSMGATSELGVQYADEVDRRAAEIEDAEETTEEMFSALGDSVQKLGNFLMVEGVVTESNASNVVSSLVNAVALLSESHTADDHVVSSGLASISRVAAEGSDSDKVDAVRVIMDTLSSHTDNSQIREAAIRCFGMLSDFPAAVRTMVDLGALDFMINIAKKNPGDENLNSLVSHTVNAITAQAQERAGEMVSSEGGTETLSGVLQANASDAGKLESVVNSICSSEGGETALWSVLASQGDTGSSGSVSTDMTTEIMRGIAARIEDNSVEEVSTRPKQVTGLAKCMSIAVKNQKALTAESDNRTKLQAFRLTDSTLSVIYAIKLDPEGSVLLAQEGGLKAAVEMVGANITDAETVQKIMKVVDTVTSHQTKETCSPIADNESMQILAQTMQLYRDGLEDEDNVIEPDRGIVKSCATVMRNVVNAMGAPESGIDRESMRTITKCQEVLMEDEQASSIYEELTEGLADEFSDEQAKIMQSKVQSSVSTVSAVANYQSHYDEDSGQFYYVDMSTGSTTWEEPEGFNEMKESLRAMAEAATLQQEDNVQNVDSQALSGMITVMNNNPKQAEVLEAAAQSLNTLAMNSGNCVEIAKNGGINAIIQAINTNPDNRALLRILLALFERVSRNDAFKEQIAQSGGIPIVTHTGLRNHIDDEEIILKCLSVLANLAFNSFENIKRIMSADGVTGIENSMQQYPNHPRILENATCALSNLMYGSNENKRIVGQTCGDEVTHIIRVHYGDTNLFKMALRALGNLSYVDENIRYIADNHGATEVIVQGMDAATDDDEAIQLSMEVLGNFASMEEDEGATKAPDYRSIPSIIYEQGGTDAILRYMKKYFQNSSILKSALNALCNICNDMETAKKVALEQGLVNVVIDILQQHDWDEEIVAHCLPLLATLTYNEDCVKMIVEVNGVQALLSTIEAHGNNEDVLTAGQLAMTNLAADGDAQKNIRDLDGVSTILLLLNNHKNSKDFCAECLATLTRLAGDDELSKIIAENGLHTIMQTIERYHDDPDFLTSAFRLLGHLAFVESNIKILVQYNGIQAIIRAISTHPKSRNLMVRSIQTLDNVAMASKENAQVVIDEGGKELIETIMETYKEDEEIQRYGKSALLSISSLENLAQAEEAETEPKEVRTTTKREEDPLREYRQLLRSGQIMSVWKKGTPKRAHVLVSPDFRSIIWQDPKTKAKLGAVDLRSVSEIKQGKGPNHKKKLLSRKEVDPTCCLSITAEKFSLDLETGQKTDVPKWVDAFQNLYEVFKTQPDKL